MIKSVNQVYALLRPGVSETQLPLVVDSPHSGTMYPFNSGIVAPAEVLQTTWDAYVDELWAGAPAVGAALLSARFPRAYIDPNRAPDDIDQEMLAQPWPHALTPSAACGRGMGLIRRHALPGIPMYQDKLSIEEVEHRLRHYYHPYHAVLKDLLDEAFQRFGRVWHINCHSMKSVGNAMNVDNGADRPDIVVSDRKGNSASSALTEWIAGEFDRRGYRVRINTPYQGGYIVQHYGVPTMRRHSIQIEIKRSVYMNEKRCEKHEGFDRLQHDLSSFLGSLAEHLRQDMHQSPPVTPAP
ncbi:MULTISPECIES: N-formylglutamate amidohydrolase [Herbaspirillum]|uniref:N-formylglutamate amidohydrolase n=1 Tax=Herbaspirillum huttiense subsp. lycopersici TaxID=3074428 RepID=A0ABU2EU66_9BURK|nr:MULTISPECIES: N-formylglutamate amidohydrolase [Herbaspirillum]MBP1313272.1 N-formylglutamate deformylase [Herbaspirillum sp. 1130]MDR9851352.1 N-formylglutamate amidohydrolase [Herbaspirillum huttiense SE1]